MNEERVLFTELTHVQGVNDSEHDELDWMETAASEPCYTYLFVHDEVFFSFSLSVCCFTLCEITHYIIVSSTEIYMPIKKCPSTRTTPVFIS